MTGTLTLSDDWQAALDEWKDAAMEFSAALSQLSRYRANAEAQGRLPEWISLMRQAGTVKMTVEWVGTNTTMVFGWLSNAAGGESNMQALAARFGLSRVPLIPFAVMRGSLAACRLMTQRMRNFVKGQ